MILLIISALLVQSDALMRALLHHEVPIFWWNLLVLIAQTYLLSWGAIN